MAYRAIDIAKYIVSYCNDKNQPISNLKLQKMMYFVWIEYYKSEKKALFTDDICAWQLGTVVPEVYYEFCPYGGIPITQTFKIEISDNDRIVVDKGIELYLPKSARELVDMTHRDNSPWDIIYQNGVGLRRVIPFELIISKECC